ncbi:MAG: ComEC/Rec2 family competence protein [Clostridia bacterium]|nr:ComEC/Rec2 family competence protein [Clostridia bacterium]
MRIKPIRPLLWLSIVYLTSIAVFFTAAVYPILPIILCVIGAVICILLILLPKVPLRKTFCILSAILLICALLQTQRIIRNYQRFQFDEPCVVALEGKVDRLSYANDSGAAFLLDVHTMDGKKTSGKIYVQSTGASARYAEPGETVKCYVLLGEETISDEEKAYRASNFADGIYAKGILTQAESFEYLSKARGFTATCHNIADACQRKFYQYLEKDAASLTSGIFLGDKTSLPAEVKRDFRRVGISHVLAVSGIHISILLGAVQWLMERIGMDKRLRLILTLLFLILFMGVTGFQKSVLRAGIMWMMSAAAFFMGGRKDGITALGFAAAVICMIRPYAIADVGFLLSVSATFGILILSEPLETFLRTHIGGRNPFTRFLRHLISLCGISLSATIATLPVTLFVFGEISIIAPIANLCMNPFVTCILYLTPILLGLSLLPFAFPASFVGWLMTLAANGLMALTSWLSSFDHILIGVRYPFLIPLFLAFAVCTVLICRRYRRVLLVYPLYFLFSLVFTVLVMLYAYQTANRVQIDIQVYKKNDIVTVISDGKGLLIDASDGAYKSARLGWDQLSDENITQLDAYLLTHYHSKHVPTFAKLSAYTVIRNLILPYPENETEASVYNALCEFAAKNNIQIQTYVRGADAVQFGNAEISVFAREMLSRSKQPLLGYTISKRDETETETTFLYLGSSAWEMEAPYSVYAEAREHALMSADVVYLGVHGPLIKKEYGDILTTNLHFSGLLFANPEIEAFCGNALRSCAETRYNMEEIGSVCLLFDDKNK